MDPHLAPPLSTGLEPLNPISPLTCSILRYKRSALVLSLDSVCSHSAWLPCPCHSFYSVCLFCGEHRCTYHSHCWAVTCHTSLQNDTRMAQTERMSAAQRNEGDLPTSSVPQELLHSDRHQPSRRGLTPGATLLLWTCPDWRSTTKPWQLDRLTTVLFFFLLFFFLTSLNSYVNLLQLVNNMCTLNLSEKSKSKGKKKENFLSWTVLISVFGFLCASVFYFCGLNIIKGLLYKKT